MNTNSTSPQSTVSYKIKSILNTLYQRFTDLEAWLKHKDTEGVLETTLLTEKDPKGYKHLLRTTLVAVKKDYKEPMSPFSLSQASYQHELVLRSVKRVLLRDGPGNNVLSFGFGQMTDNPKASVTSVNDLECRHSSSSVSRLQCNVWNTLLSRIGDSLMTHLVENTSIFVLLVKPAVYLQVTGEPVFQLWSYTAGSSLSISVPDHSSEKQNTRKPVDRSSKLNFKKRKRKQETGQLEVSPKVSKTEQTTVIFPCNDSEDAAATGSEHPEQNALRQNTGRIQNKKRKVGNDAFVPDCKRMKIHLNERKCLTFTIPNEIQTDFSKYTDAEHQTPSLHAAVVSPVEKVMPETSVVTLNSTADTDVELIATETTGRSQTSKTKRQRKRLRQKRKREKQLSCTPGINAFQFHKYVPRLSLLYGRNPREKFPPNFKLAKFGSSENGAQLLFRDIFAHTDVGGNVIGNGQPCQCLNKEPVPYKKWKQMASQSDTGFSAKSVVGCNTDDSTTNLPEVTKNSENGMLSSNQRSCGGVVLPFTESSEYTIPCGERQLEDDPKCLVVGNTFARSTPTCTTASHFSKCSFMHSQFASQRSHYNRDDLNVSQNISMQQQLLKSGNQKPFGSTCEQTEISESEVTGCKSHKPHLAHRTGTGLTRKVAQQKVVSSTSQKQTGNALNQNTAKGPCLEPQVQSNLQDGVLPLLQKILNSHRKCRYWAFLNHHCPCKYDCRKRLSTETNGNDSKQAQAKTGVGKGKTCHRYRKRLNKQPATAKLLEDHVPYSKVFAFLKAVLKQTIPAQLFDCPGNTAVFLKNVQTWVSAGKFEKLCLGQLMKGMKVKGCKWLSGVTCPKMRQHYMAKLIWWIMVYFILPLVKAFFYLTDTTTYRNRVLFYRKRIWHRLQTRAMHEFKKAATLQNISQARLTELLAAKRTLGVSVLRFLPKSQSVRPIVNMSSKPKPGVKQRQSINKQLARLFQALTFEKKLDAGVCGCSVFGLDDIYMKLKEFKEERAACHDKRCLYFVKSDISKCFDSIQQQQLFSIVKNILTKHNQQTYNARKYATVHVAGNRLKRTFHTDTARQHYSNPDFVSFIRQHCSRNMWNDVIVVDQAKSYQESSRSLLDTLSSHLFYNVIKMGGAHYIQRTGISQGSVVSSLLANIYLADLEAKHLSTEKGELLIRWMDDYLFMTPNRAHAQEFVDTMWNGFPEYNCFVSVDKMLTNFPVTQPVSGTIECTEQGGAFSWCGLMINTSTLDVSVDYSRYSGLNITDTATFDASYKAGQTLKNKLFMCLKIKSHVIFFDPVLNSRERILLNVYQVFLFMARIFHSFVNKLPAAQRVESSSPFFCDVVRAIPYYFQTLVTKRLTKMKSAHPFLIPVEVLQWLNADAFLMRLHQYPGYRPLKKFLRARRLFMEKQMGKEHAAPLKEVRRSALQLDSDIVLF